MSNDNKKPVYAVDDYQAIAYRLRDLELEREEARHRMEATKQQECIPCKGRGWIWVDSNATWLVCGYCDNTMRMPKPKHALR